MRSFRFVVSIAIGLASLAAAFISYAVETVGRAFATQPWPVIDGTTVRAPFLTYAAPRIDRHEAGLSRRSAARNI